MAFICPDCLTPGSLTIRHSIALPSDSRSDEIALQVVECAACGFRGAAVYEESRRGSLDSEAWEHTGYRVTDAVVETLIDQIRRCPAPSKENCRCPTHLALGQKDERGRWQWPGDMEGQDIYPMRLVAGG